MNLFFHLACPLGHLLYPLKNSFLLIMEDNIKHKIFFDKFKAEKKSGEGSFGKIYRGFNITTKQLVAMKFENRGNNLSLLETEAYRMMYLKGEGIPEVYCYGNNRDYNILVIEHLGKTLEESLEFCNRKFSLPTVLRLGFEMLNRIEFIHERNHIHRDLKPDNFMTGIGNTLNKLYIIDFGLAKKYRSSKTKTHISFTQYKKLTGTIRYASLNASRYYEQSRRDDVESIGYILLYLLNGRLPWQGLKMKEGDDKYKKIFIKKRDIDLKDLCKDTPSQFQEYIEYCRKIRFEDQPNYDYLRSLILTMLGSNKPDLIEYDWNIKSKKSAKKKTLENKKPKM